MLSKGKEVLAELEPSAGARRHKNIIENTKINKWRGKIDQDPVLLYPRYM